MESMDVDETCNHNHGHHTDNSRTGGDCPVSADASSSVNSTGDPDCQMQQEEEDVTRTDRKMESSNAAADAGMSSAVMTEETVVVDDKKSREYFATGVPEERKMDTSILTTASFHDSNRTELYQPEEEEQASSSMHGEREEPVTDVGEVVGIATAVAATGSGEYDGKLKQQQEDQFVAGRIIKKESCPASSLADANEPCVKKEPSNFNSKYDLEQAIEPAPAPRVATSTRADLHDSGHEGEWLETFTSFTGQKKKKSFVKKTKRRVVDHESTDSDGILDALIVDESTRKRTSRMWKIRLVVNDCIFPSGAPVPTRPHTIMTATTSLTGSRVRSSAPFYSQTTSHKSQETKNLMKQQQKERGGRQQQSKSKSKKDSSDLALSSLSRRTRSSSYDASALLQGDSVDSDDETSTHGSSTRKRKKRGQARQQQEIQISGVVDVDPAGDLPFTIPRHLISHDGNYHYCRICQLTGEVVCCDGCPNVLHRDCMPTDEPARVTLDKYPDDEEWFCPDCRAKQEARPTPAWQEEAIAAAVKINQETGSFLNINVAAESGVSENDAHEESAGFLNGRTGRGRGRGRGRSKGGSKLSGLSSSSQRKMSEAESAISSNSPPQPNISVRKSPSRNAKKNAPEYSEVQAEDELTDVEDNDSVDSPDSENGSVRSASLTSVFPSRRHGGKRKVEKDRDGSSSNPHLEGGKRNRSRSRSEDMIDGDFGADQKPSDPQSLWPPQVSVEHSETQQKMKRKKQKKKQHTLAATGETAPASPLAINSDINDQTSLEEDEGVKGGMPKATPAFFFFMNENRSKIERSLARKHKSFQRLPKGIERNAFVTKEAASWWKKLDANEIKRYMDISMQQYEQRIIEWKEEKTIREMTEVPAKNDSESIVGNATDLDERDEELTYENYQRLYRATDCGHRPYKPSSTSNRVLLELLQDIRFHPRPMIQLDREPKDYGQIDAERVTVPFFDVQGPVATSLGDECLGCSRGWVHFCHVLKRKVPSVEHRAKLQPPLSSLMATRVGLGLKDHVALQPENQSEDVELFACRNIPEISEAANLESPKFDSLLAPSRRADDIVRFIEELAHMKVLDPPAPTVPSIQDEAHHEHKTKKPHRRTVLPIGRRRTISEGESKEIITDEDGAFAHKCGRCRETIDGVTGCIPCRRAQLVINMGQGGHSGDNYNGTLKQDSRNDANQSLPVVNSVMLGRINMKDSATDPQPISDAAVSNYMLRERWAPFSILPPTTHESPVHKGRKRPRGGTDSRPNNFRTLEDNNNGRAFILQPDSGTTTKESGKEDVKVQEVATFCRLSASSPTNDILSPDLSSPKHGELVDVDGELSKRIRTRGKPSSLASGRNSPSFECEDRPQLSQKLKDKSSELNKKIVSVACCGIYLALVRRDPLLLFAEPADAEGYISIIKKPVDFSQIRENILSGNYVTLGAFVADARLLCTNALYFNAPETIYARTAKDLLEVLNAMHKRATKWMTTLKDAVALAVRQAYKSESPTMFDDVQKLRDSKLLSLKELLSELRSHWPKAVGMLESEEALRKQVELDFRRTKENEIAYYGAIAIRRVATAAAASLAPYPDSGGTYNVVTKRSYMEDERLRHLIVNKVVETLPPQLKDIPTWREDAVVKLLRKAQNKRVEVTTDSLNGCARVDGVDGSETHYKIAMSAEALSSGRKRKYADRNRVAKSRKSLTTGVGSKALRDLIEKRREDFAKLRDEKGVAALSSDHVDDAAVIVKGSRIHGWGLFADQLFKKGDFVAEYIGEYVSPAVTDAREKLYRRQRIQDYQFRLDDTLVIDATMRGGHGRYINHSCSPNCVAKIVPGDPPNEHLKRVIILADRDISSNEEFSYDYQFGLEEDLAERIPCNCQAEACRGFMNWDLPEKAANLQELLGRKKVNIRDRIRRLGRPSRAKTSF